MKVLEDRNLPSFSVGSHWALSVFSVDSTQFGCHFFAAVPDQILFILAGNDNIHKSFYETKIEPGLTTNQRASCPSESENSCCHFFLVAIYLIHFEFVGFENMHNT